MAITIPILICILSLFLQVVAIGGSLVRVGLYITYTKLCDNTNFLPSVSCSSSIDIWVVVISNSDKYIHLEQQLMNSKDINLFIHAI